MSITFERRTFKEDVTGLGLEDIRAMMLEITARDVTRQENLGNEVTLTYVDGYINKRISDVKKKIEVIFGAELASSAKETVTKVLRAAILKSTEVKTGTLSDMSKWEWLFIRDGRPVNVADTPMISFKTGDMLILKPRDVKYSTMVNMWVSRGSQSMSIRMRKTDKNPTGYRKSTSNLGYMGATTAILKRMTVFRNFNIYTAFTKNFRVPGELSNTQGTACIVIKPKSRRFGVTNG